MGMDVHIAGECEKDEKFESMLEIAQNCKKLGIHLPPEVDEYFGGQDPDSMRGPRVELRNALEGDVMMGGAVIHLDKIPESVKRIIVQASI